MAAGLLIHRDRIDHVERVTRQLGNTEGRRATGCES